jgi:hypothetical protein
MEWYGSVFTMYCSKDFENKIIFHYIYDKLKA